MQHYAGPHTSATGFHRSGIACVAPDDVFAIRTYGAGNSTDTRLVRTSGHHNPRNHRSATRKITEDMIVAQDRSDAGVTRPKIASSLVKSSAPSGTAHSGPTSSGKGATGANCRAGPSASHISPDLAR